MRQKDQTVKKATGNFDRDGLLNYLEKEAMEYKDREDVVPFTGERKGVCMCVCACVSEHTFSMPQGYQMPFILAFDLLAKQTCLQCSAECYSPRLCDPRRTGFVHPREKESWERRGKARGVVV